MGTLPRQSCFCMAENGTVLAPYRGIVSARGLGTMQAASASFSDAQRSSAALPVGVLFLRAAAATPGLQCVIIFMGEECKPGRIIFCLESWHFFCSEGKSTLPSRDRSAFFCLSKAHRNNNMGNLAEMLGRSCDLQRFVGWCLVA